MGFLVDLFIMWLSGFIVEAHQKKNDEYSYGSDKMRETYIIMDGAGDIKNMWESESEPQSDFDIK